MPWRQQPSRVLCQLLERLCALPLPSMLDPSCEELAVGPLVSSVVVCGRPQPWNLLGTPLIRAAAMATIAFSGKRISKYEPHRDAAGRWVCGVLELKDPVVQEFFRVGQETSFLFRLRNILNSHLDDDLRADDYLLMLHAVIRCELTEEKECASCARAVRKEMESALFLGEERDERFSHVSKVSTEAPKVSSSNDDREKNAVSTKPPEPAHLDLCKPSSLFRQFCFRNCFFPLQFVSLYWTHGYGGLIVRQIVDRHELFNRVCTSVCSTARVAMECKETHEEIGHADCFCDAILTRCEPKLHAAMTALGLFCCVPKTPARHPHGFDGTMKQIASELTDLDARLREVDIESLAFCALRMVNVLSALKYALTMNTGSFDRFESTLPSEDPNLIPAASEETLKVLQGVAFTIFRVATERMPKRLDVADGTLARMVAQSRFFACAYVRAIQDLRTSGRFILLKRTYSQNRIFVSADVFSLIKRSFQSSDLKSMQLFASNPKSGRFVLHTTAKRASLERFDILETSEKLGLLGLLAFRAYVESSLPTDDCTAAFSLLVDAVGELTKFLDSERGREASAGCASLCSFGGSRGFLPATFVVVSLLLRTTGSASRMRRVGQLVDRAISEAMKELQSSEPNHGAVEEALRVIAIVMLAVHPAESSPLGLNAELLSQAKGASIARLRIDASTISIDVLSLWMRCALLSESDVVGELGGLLLHTAKGKPVEQLFPVLQSIRFASVGELNVKLPMTEEQLVAPSTGELEQAFDTSYDLLCLLDRRCSVVKETLDTHNGLIRTVWLTLNDLMANRGPDELSLLKGVNFTMAHRKVILERIDLWKSLPSLIHRVIGHNLNDATLVSATVYIFQAYLMYFSTLWECAVFLNQAVESGAVRLSVARTITQAITLALRSTAEHEDLAALIVLHFAGCRCCSVGAVRNLATLSCMKS